MMTENFENVNHLVLNFYLDGYSIAVKLNEFPVFTSETILETAKISYEETSLLDYIENEELPPLLVEMIDGSPKLNQYKIWHNGCLILEVRDKINYCETTADSNFTIHQKAAKEFPKQSNQLSSQVDMAWIPDQNDYDSSVRVSKSTQPTRNGSYFILLKPTNLSMLNDVLNLTGSNSWSTQDRLQLESQIVLHNSPPLFLEPDMTKQPPEQGSHSPNLKISNISTKLKKKLPHTKLMSIYRNIAGVGCSKNYFFNNTNNVHSSYNINNRTQPDSLPPELTLQQFLATKRAKKKTFSAGHLARFHRFKKHLNNNRIK